MVLFCKKEPKKLSDFDYELLPPESLKDQKFFASFFQKRRPFFLPLLRSPYQPMLLLARGQLDGTIPRIRRADKPALVGNGQVVQPGAATPD